MTEGRPQHKRLGIISLDDVISFVIAEVAPEFKEGLRGGRGVLWGFNAEDELDCSLCITKRDIILSIMN